MSWSVTTARWRTCGASPPGATSSRGTTSTSRTSTSRPWRPTASPCIPAPTPCASPRTRGRCGRGSSELGIPCPRWRGIESAADLDEFAGLVGWPLVLKAARGGYDGKGVWVVGNALEAAALLAELLAVRHAADRRGEGADRARTRRRRGALAVGAGRGVAGRRDGAAGRHLRRGDRAGPGAVRGAGRRGAAARAADRGRARRHRRAGRRAVRDDGRAVAGERAGDASAQLGALDDRGRAHVAVRAAPARRARLPARRDLGDRARRGDGQPARRARRGGPQRHRRTRASLHGPSGRT